MVMVLFLLHTRHIRMGHMVVLHRMTNESACLLIIAKVCLALEDRRTIIPPLSLDIRPKETFAIQ